MLLVVRHLKRDEKRILCAGNLKQESNQGPFNESAIQQTRSLEDRIIESYRMYGHRNQLLDAARSRTLEKTWHWHLKRPEKRFRFAVNLIKSGTVSTKAAIQQTRSFEDSFYGNGHQYQFYDVFRSNSLEKRCRCASKFKLCRRSLSIVSMGIKQKRLLL